MSFLLLLLLRSTLIVILIFCNYSPSSDAIRSFPIKEPEKKNLYETLVMLSESNDGFRFSEAPEFRNGANCYPLKKGFVSWCDLSSSDHVVHISMTLDFEYLRGSMAAILSVLKHASCPDDIVFHFIAIESEQRSLIQLIRSTFPSLINFKVYPFREEDHVKNLISSSIREALENPLNYARNYLADLVEPCVKRVIYLDSDLVVVDDIQKLWNISLITAGGGGGGSRRVIGAPEYCHTNFTSYFTDVFWSDSEMSSKVVFSGRNHQPCYFNTGVMVMDLERWREGDYRRRIEGWMELQKQKRIYELGSLPPFLLVFAGDIQAIDHRWNQHGLGGDNVMGSCRSLHPGPVSLLHWSGKGKPWLRLDQRNPCPLDHLWEPYDLYLPHQLRSPSMTPTTRTLTHF